MRGGGLNYDGLTANDVTDSEFCVQICSLTVTSAFNNPKDEATGLRVPDSVAGREGGLLGLPGLVRCQIGTKKGVSARRIEEISVAGF